MVFGGWVFGDHIEYSDLVFLLIAEDMCVCYLQLFYMLQCTLDHFLGSENFLDSAYSIVFGIFF